MPATLREVLKSNTFEQQRQIINTLANDFFAYTTGTGSSTFLNLEDGSQSNPALFFATDNSVGLYKSSSQTLGVASQNIKVFTFNDTENVTYKPFKTFNTVVNSASIANNGQYYRVGTFATPVSGGSGSGLVLNVTVSAFSSSITNVGSGYTPGDYTVNITGGSGTGGTAVVSVAGIAGTITNGGSGYPETIYNDVPLQGGNGTGATANIEITGGVITLVTITSSGSGYQNGNTLTIDNADLSIDANGDPQTSTGSGFVFTITNSPYTIASISPSTTWSGEGYEINDSCGIDLSPGSGFAFTLTDVGFISDVSGINNGGSEYSVNDIVSPISSLSFGDTWSGIVSTFTINVQVRDTGGGIFKYSFDLGDGNGYVDSPALTLRKDSVYNFVFATQSDYTNYSLAFSTISDGIHSPSYTGSEDYTTNVRQLTQSIGVQLYVNSTTPSTLYYYSPVASGLGSSIAVSSLYGQSATFTVDTLSTTETVSIGLAGNINSVGSITTTSANFGSVSVSGASNLTTASITQTLNVTGDATFVSNIDVDGIAELDDVNISNELNVLGESNFNLINTNNLVVSNVAEIDGPVWADGGAEFGPRTLNKGLASIDVNGNINTAGSVIIDTDLTVNGTASLSSITLDGDINSNGSITAEEGLLVNSGQLVVDHVNGFIGINATDFVIDPILNPLQYGLEIYSTLYNSGDVILADSPNSIVKIGNTTSSEKLSVAGNISALGSLTIEDGTSEFPSLRFQSSSTSGLYSYPDGNFTGLGITNVSGDIAKFGSGDIKFYRNLDFVYDVIGDYTINGGIDYVYGNYSLQLAGGSGFGLTADVTVAFETAITSAGSGYDAAEYIGVSLSPVSSAPAGAILGFNLTSPGSNYINGTYLNVPLINGSGSNATADITISGGTISQITPNQIGSSYQVGDILNFDVEDVGGSQLGTLVVDNGGSGYTDGTYSNIPLVTVSGTGSGATVSITVESGSVTSASVLNRGVTYSPTDSLTVNNSDISITTIQTLNIINGGSGYQDGTFVDVALIGEFGDQTASADFTVSGNTVTNVTINQPGQEYNIGDQLTASLPGVGVIQTIQVLDGFGGYSDGVVSGVAITGGTGSNATATVTILSGAVSAVDVEFGGTGYLEGDEISLNGFPDVLLSVSSIDTPSGLLLEVATITSGSGVLLSPDTFITGSGASIEVGEIATGSGGSGALANITVDDFGSVSNVVVSNGGSGYAIGDTLRVEDVDMIYELDGNPVTSSVPSTQMLLTVTAKGVVTIVNITEFGEGYYANDVLTTDNANLGGRGSGFSLTVDTIDSEITVSIDEKLGQLQVKQFDARNLSVDNSLLFSGTGINKITAGNFLLSAVDYVQILGTSALILPAGNTLQRPGLAADSAGAIRFNTEELRFEGFDGSYFVSLGGVRDVDGNTYITAELNPGDDDNILRFVNNDTQSMQIEETAITLQTIENITKTNIDGIPQWSPGDDVIAGVLPEINYLYHEENVYSIDNDGTLDVLTPPSHIVGTVVNGDVSLTYVRSIYGNLRYKGSKLNVTVNELNINDNALKISGDTSTQVKLISESPDFIIGFKNTNDPLLKLTNNGALSVNIGFGGTESYVKVLDSQLKQFDLKDTRILSGTGSIDTSVGNSVNITIASYNITSASLPLHSGKLMIEIIDDAIVPRRQYSEISYLVKSDLSDIIYTESNKIYSDVVLCDVSVGIDGSNNITCDVVDITGSPSTIYSVKVVSQAILV